MTYHELDTVRLLEAQEGPGLYGQGVVNAVPAGAEGTVVQVFDDALEVEFTVRPPEIAGDEVLHTGTFHVIALTTAQVEPVL